MSSHINVKGVATGEYILKDDLVWQTKARPDICGKKSRKPSSEIVTGPTGNYKP
jgi:hypothetical protein